MGKKDWGVQRTYLWGRTKAERSSISSGAEGAGTAGWKKGTGGAAGSFTVGRARSGGEAAWNGGISEDRWDC